MYCFTVFYKTPTELPRRQKKDKIKALKLSFKRLNFNDLYGALGRIRTSDRSVRSRVLYPAELRVHMLLGRGAYGRDLEVERQVDF